MKVFLGGTCNGTTWRDELMPLLPCEFFNPVVEDWTPDCIEKEDYEKDHLCDIHLYLITPAMKGIYSIVEMMNSLRQPGKTTLIGFLESPEWDEGMKRSIGASINLITTRYPESKCGWIKEPKDIVEWIEKL